MYIGNDLQIAHPSYKIIDDISSGFNGSTTSFALQVSGATPVPFPISTQQVMISVNGVVQEPDPTGSAGFKLLGSNIVFSSAPANGHAFFGVINAGADYVTAGSEFPDGSVTSPSFTFQDDQDTGWFRIGSGSVGYSANGVQILNFDGNGLTVTGDASFVGDSSKNLLWDKSDGQLEFADNAKAVFGAGSDLTIYHNGTNSIVGDTGAGELSLQSNGAGIRLWNSANGETLLYAINNGAVELYHNNSKTLYTNSLGVDVKGGDTSSKTQLSIWGNEGQRGVLQISADDGDDNADHWQFQARTDGNLNIQNLNSGSWGNSAVFVGGGAVNLYNNNVKVFETMSNGIRVLGTENDAAYIYMSADEGDDNADKWVHKVATTGVYSIGNYSTGSWVDNLAIDGSGHVGIGRSSGLQLLDVKGVNDDAIKLSASAYGGGHLRITGSDTNIGGTAGPYNHTIRFKTKTQNNNAGNGAEKDALILYHEGWSGLNLASFPNSKLGVGIAEPDCELEVSGATDPKLKIESQESGNKRLELWIDGGAAVGYIAANQSASSLQFQTTNTTALTISSTQNATFAASVSDSKGNLRSIPKNQQSSAYTLVASDAGKCIPNSSGGWTINNNVFNSGDAITLYNNSSSNQTISKGSGCTLYHAADGSSATGRTLAPRGIATIYILNTSEFVISGAGLT